MKDVRLLPTWRWYGPKDPISLQDVGQTQAEGIVTALHHIPHGAVWTREDIRRRKTEISKSGLSWSVVESLPVHESIKTRSGNYLEHLDNYRQSLLNLAAEEIKTVCYNFMPVLDWTRTNLSYELPDKSLALRFDMTELAVFDIHVLQRSEALQDYSEDIIRKAAQWFSNAGKMRIDTLTSSILMGIPGEESPTIAALRKDIAIYSHIGHGGLRNNLVAFLEFIMPVCEELDIQMVIHPDDPPFDILGLPRIVSNAEDLQFILEKIGSSHNGICFCSGSLGAGKANNLPQILYDIGDRVNFVHLRNISKEPDGSFNETAHLSGDVDMFTLMSILTEIQKTRNYRIPFRADHGLQILDDLHKETLPGYSMIGRLKGLAELRGLALGVSGSKSLH
jgi:mannonate dehydratase